MQLQKYAMWLQLWSAWIQRGFLWLEREQQFYCNISLPFVVLYDFIKIFIILQLCEFCISSMVRQGIQILQIEDKTTIINDTSYQIYYRPQLFIFKPHSGEEVKHCRCCLCLLSVENGCLHLYLYLDEPYIAEFGTEIFRHNNHKIIYII